MRKCDFTTAERIGRSFAARLPPRPGHAYNSAHFFSLHSNLAIRRVVLLEMSCVLFVRFCVVLHLVVLSCVALSLDSSLCFRYGSQQGKNFHRYQARWSAAVSSFFRFFEQFYSADLIDFLFSVDSSETSLPDLRSADTSLSPSR